jgi:signal transduction histidine kinase
VTSGPISGGLWPRGGPVPGCYRPNVETAAADPVPPSGSVRDALDAAVRGIAGLASVDDVLQLIVDRVRPVIGAQYAALGIVDDTGRIERFITSGMDAATRRAIGPLPEGHGMLGLIIHENRSFRIPDINRDPHRHGFPPNHPPMSSFLGTPIIYGGETIGRLYLTNKIGAAEFSDDELRLLETFALHAGIAMTNARLLDRSRLLAVAEERDRISKDLHDGIIQNLYAVSLALEEVAEQLELEDHDSAGKVDRAIDSIHHAIGDIRNFIVGLRPDAMVGIDLGTGLASIVDEAREHTSVDISIDVEELDEPEPEISSHLLALAREGLSNVIRHSGATSARVVVIAPTLDDDELRLIIEDDGRGFDPEAVARHGHQGLANMRDRAAAIGASISWQPGPTGGTRVVINVPQMGGTES